MPRSLRTVAYLAPMWSELRPLVRGMGLRRTGLTGCLDAHEGVVGDARVVAARTGVGPARGHAAAASVIAAAGPDVVVLVGIAGGLDPDLAIGDLVVPDRVEDATSGAVTRPIAPPQLTPRGTLLTTDGLLDPTELRTHVERGLLAADMEASGVGAACHEAGVSWSVIRAISDRMDDGLVDGSTMDMLRPDGTPDLRAVARTVLTRPRTVPRLIRLGRDMDLATKVAARCAMDAWTPRSTPPATKDPRTTQQTPRMGSPEPS